MSKSQRKGKAKKKSPDVALQELQANIDSLSLREAMAAVKNAKAMVEKLKKEQADALQDIQRTKSEIKATEMHDETSKQYGATSYWEQRYSSVSSRDADTSSYEWYMSFGTFGPIITPDLRAALARQSVATVLVAGCGNSMLCEDLYRHGFTNIIGMDSSASVIAAKAKLAADLGYCINYIQADMCNMPEVASSSVAVIVDKGTLDAIVSADKDHATMSFQRALDYLSEIFRLLLPQGSLLLLTTLPPHLLQELLQPLALKTATSATYATDAGRDIYYYTFMKTHEVVYNSGSAAGSNNIMNNFMDVLRTATDQLKSENNMTLDDLATAAPVVSNSANDVQTSSTLPNVQIALVDDSVLMVGGDVCVQYSKRDDEDDFIALHASTSATCPIIGAATPDYDALEYICTAQTTATLPLSHGGCYCVTYNRTITTIDGANVTRSNVVLAVTPIFNVSTTATSLTTADTTKFKNSRSAFKGYTDFSTLVEYQPRVRKATATLLAKATRVQCWSNSNIIVVEFDNWTNETYTTEFAKVDLHPNLKYSTITAVTTESSIVITATTSGDIAVAVSTTPSTLSSIGCGFCGNIVCDKELQISQLPSGIFEHMMDECICAQSDVPLAISELKPLPSTVLINDMIVCINSKDTTDTTSIPIGFKCKESCSLIDMLLLDVCYQSQQLQTPFINISSSTVICNRCHMTLGDAQFATTTTASSTSTAIEADDMESIQFLRHMITASGLTPVTSTQILCKYMQHVVKTYNTSCFLFQSKYDTSRSIFLRLLSRDEYYIQLHDTITAGMKVSFYFNAAGAHPKVKCSRIALEDVEIDQLISDLESTKLYFSEVSCFENEMLGVLVI